MYGVEQYFCFVLLNKMTVRGEGKVHRRESRITVTSFPRVKFKKRKKVVLIVLI